MTNTPTPPPSVPQGMREAIARLENDAFACEVAGYAVHYYGSDKVQLAKDIRLLLAAIAPHVAQAPFPFVVEIRSRNRDKDLSPWHAVAAFSNEEEAKHFLGRWAEIGYARMLSAATPPSLPASEGKALLHLRNVVNRVREFAEQDEVKQLMFDSTVSLESALRKAEAFIASPVTASPPTAVLTRAKEALELTVREVECYCCDNTANRSPCAHCMSVPVLRDLTALLSAPENKEKNKL